MQGLTIQNIQRITETIDRAGITFSHLREDLIDHICCEIEAQLAAGSDFNQAFEKIKVNFGIESLQQVQEKTLLLIDKNYCVMKTTLKVTGIISTLLLIFGSLFKIYHWPGASIIITSGFFILCFMFLPSANYTMLKEGKDKRLILLFLSAFLGGSGFFLGILFKIQHWQGTSVLLTAGTVLLSLVFFPLLLRFLFRKSDSTREKVIYTIGVVSGMLFFIGMLFKLLHWPAAGIIQMTAAICIAFLFVPLFSHLRYASSKYIEPGFIYIIGGISWFFMFVLLVSLWGYGSLLQTFNSTDQNIQNQIGLLENENESVYSLPVDSGTNEKLQKAKFISNELNDYIRNLKIEIIRAMDERNQSSVYDGNKIDVTKIEENTNTNKPYVIMTGLKSPGKAAELKTKLISTRNEFLNLTNNDETITQLVGLCLNTDLPEGAPEWIQSWEMLYFEHTTVIGCLDVLSCFQRNLRVAENEVINYLVKHTNI
jgi:hypothetical protein